MSLKLLVCLISGVGACSSTIPTSNSGNNAVQVSFYSNPNRGTMGAACPVACNTAIATQWFKINTDATNTCLSWPGNSGENSMRSGSCHSTSMYSYSRWITCDCSGGETVKDAKSDGCYIDNPTSLCSRAVDMVKFHWLHDHQLRYSDRSDGVWFCRRRVHLRHCLEYLLQY